MSQVLLLMLHSIQFDVQTERKRDRKILHITPQKPQKEQENMMKKQDAKILLHNLHEKGHIRHPP